MHYCGCYYYQTENVGELCSVVTEVELSQLSNSKQGFSVKDNLINTFFISNLKVRAKLFLFFYFNLPHESNSFLTVK